VHKGCFSHDKLEKPFKESLEMKFTLNTSIALASFSQALRTCNVKSKGQPDSEFLFEKNADKLTVTSLNETSEQQIVVPTVSISGDDGKFSVAGQAVVEFLRQISDNEVSCTFNKTNNVFYMVSTDPSRQTKFAFPVGDPEDFLPIAFRATGTEFEIPGSALATALHATAFAASTDSSQAPQTAVRLKVCSGGIVAEASDFHRISSYSASIPEEDSMDDASLLLRKDISETLSVLLSDISTVKVILAANHVRFLWDDTVFTCVLESEMKKKFAPVEKFFDGELEGSATLSKGDFQRALKLASLVAKDSSVGIKLEGSKIVITTKEQDRGASQDAVVCQKSEGESSTFSAWKYLVKAVDICVSPWIELQFRQLPNNMGAALIVVDNEYSHLIFPVLPKGDEEEEED
jgi:DNA polymerase III sliding clamp (beta) subunit (PCNA family)